MNVINYFKEKGKSKYKEKLIEHAFYKDLLISSANRYRDVFIAQSQSGIFGRSTIVQCRQSRKTIVIQLKVMNENTRVWHVHKTLLKSKTGHVVLIEMEEKKRSVEFNYFFFDKQRLKEILSQTPGKTNSEMYRTIKSDYIKVPAGKLHNKIFR